MRCNVGVCPKYLLDAWLIAEYRELPMVTGSLRVNDWKIKSPVPGIFNLGKGHINFFKTRLAYLRRRHEAIKEEMECRGFKCDVLEIKQEDCPLEYWNDWTPSMEDSVKLRERLVEKIMHNKLPINWWRFNRVNLSNETVEAFLDNIKNGELFYV